MEPRGRAALQRRVKPRIGTLLQPRHPKRPVILSEACGFALESACAVEGSLHAHPHHDHVREFSPYSVDRVERTLLSAAFDVGLDFDRKGHEFHRAT
jgi:hypothetical protein